MLLASAAATLMAEVTGIIVEADESRLRGWIQSVRVASIRDVIKAGSCERAVFRVVSKFKSCGAAPS